MKTHFFGNVLRPVSFWKVAGSIPAGCIFCVCVCVCAGLKKNNKIGGMREFVRETERILSYLDFSEFSRSYLELSESYLSYLGVI
jgi:hypothetical protein